MGKIAPVFLSLFLTGLPAQEAPLETATGVDSAPPAIRTDSLPTVDTLTRLTAPLAGPADSLPYLGKMVITATRTARPLSQTPASVTVITQEEISAAPARNIDDLLASTKGVVVKRTAGMGEGIPSSINMRGVPGALTAARTLVLVDGIPTNASGTPFLILNEIPLESIRKIEVVRGPFSSLYGANAFGGVVNVITTSPGDKPEVQAYGGLGNSVFWEGGAAHGWRVGDFSYYVNGGIRGIGNILARDSAIARNGESIRTFKAENFQYRDNRLFGKATWALDDKSWLELHARYFDSELGFGRTKHIPDTADIFTKGRKYIAAPFLNLSLGSRWKIKTGGYYRQVKGSFLAEAIADQANNIWVPSIWEAVSNDWQAETRASVRLRKGEFITLGFESLWNTADFGATLDRATRKAVENSKPKSARINNSGLFLQYEGSLFQKLFWVPGIRVDRHSDFGLAVSPKVGFAYDMVEWLKLRTSVGRGFRAPDLGELYLPDLRPTAGATVISNPNLKPEALWAVDGGATLCPWRWFSLQVDGFYNKMSNLIMPQFISLTSSGVNLSFLNVQSAASAGLELSAEAEALEWLFISGSYTYTWSRDDDTEGALDYFPENKSSGGLRVRKALGRYLVEGSITEGYVGDRSYLDWEHPALVLNAIQKSKWERVFLDPYWRTDLALKLTFIEKLWASFEITNLTDEKFEEAGGTLSPGKLFSARLGAGF